MARLTEKGISGVIGNMIFYPMDGKNYIRARPGKRDKKRGQPADPLNIIFGTVSTYGTRMIKQMKRSFLFRFTRNTYNQGRGWMRNQYAAQKDDAIWELSARPNVICQLNNSTDFRDFLGAEIIVTNDSNGIIRVLIPEINPKKDLKAPSRTIKVNLKMIAVTSPFQEKSTGTNFCMELYNFNYSDSIIPAKECILDTKAAAGDIAIVVIALEFETTGSGTNIYNIDPHWLPAAVVAMGRLKN